MILSIPKIKYRAVGLVALGSVILVLLFAGVVLADAIDDGLPANTPAAVKASARQAIQNGLASQSVVKLTRTMLTHNFNEQQIKTAHQLMIEAHNNGMPVAPLHYIRR